MSDRGKALNLSAGAEGRGGSNAKDPLDSASFAGTGFGAAPGLYALSLGHDESFCADREAQNGLARGSGHLEWRGCCHGWRPTSKARSPNSKVQSPKSES